VYWAISFKIRKKRILGSDHGADTCSEAVDLVVADLVAAASDDMVWVRCNVPPRTPDDNALVVTLRSIRGCKKSGRHQISGKRLTCCC
jgi:hypothetical protein